jgi:zinc protease
MNGVLLAGGCATLLAIACAPRPVVETAPVAVTAPIAPAVPEPQIATSPLAPATAEVAATPALPAMPANTTPPKIPEHSTIPEQLADLTYPAMNYLPPDLREYRVVLRDQTVPGDSVVAYLVPAPELPLLHLQLLFKEEGLVSDTALVTANAAIDAMYKRGGTRELAPAAVEDALEFRGVDLGLSIGAEQSSLSLDLMATDLPAYLQLLRSIALEPRMDSTRLALLKLQMRQNLNHRYDQPASASGDLLSHILYGSQPVTWKADTAQLAKVNPAMLKKLAQGRFHKKGMVIGIAGRFDRAQMIAQLDSLLASWNPTGAPPAEIAAAIPKPVPGLYLIDFPSTQAHVRMAQPFLQRPHPDFYATAIASYILGGGGFTSRLTASVRTREGLAYSVGSYAGSSYFSQATTGVSLQTKAESAARAVKIVFEEIRRLTDEGPTAEELASAIEGLEQSLPSLFDTPENTVDAFVMNEAWGRDLDHYRQYGDQLRAVKAGDVRRVLKLYFRPEVMAVTLVGPAKLILAPDPKDGTRLDSLSMGTVHSLTLDELLRR